MELRQIQKLGAVSAILEGLIYITAFTIYGGVLVYPGANANAIEKLNFLTENQFILSLLNLTSYVLFGILLAVLVQAIHLRLKDFSPHFSKLTSVFGFLWVGLVIASGMISNIGLSSVIEMGVKDPERAMLVESSVSIMRKGLEEETK